VWHVHAVAHKKGLVTEKKNGKEVIRHTFSLAMLPAGKIASQIFTEHKLLIINFLFPPFTF